MTSHRSSSFKTFKGKSRNQRSKEVLANQRMLRKALVSAGRKTIVIGQQEIKYVDAVRPITPIHPLADTANDTWADTELNPLNNSGIIGCLPVPAQGDSFAQRDGRKIYMKDIKLKGLIRWNGANNSAVITTQPVVRVVIVKDTKTNGVTLSGEDVIGAGQGSDGATINSGSANAINFMTNPSGWSRYKIVYDKSFRCPNGVTSSGDATSQDVNGTQMPWKAKIKCNHDVNFDGTTGVIGAVIDNSYHVLVASQQVSGSNPSMSYVARTSFIG